MSSSHDVPWDVTLLRGVLRFGGCPHSCFYVTVNWKQGEAELDGDAHTCAVLQRHSCALVSVALLKLP